MDQPWTQARWQPTVNGDFEPPASEYDRQHETAISLTLSIKDSPYNPFLSFKRGEVLLVLGYPELAAGDHHKARLLFEAGRKHLEDLITSANGSTANAAQSILDSLESDNLDQKDLGAAVIRAFASSTLQACFPKDFVTMALKIEEQALGKFREKFVSNFHDHGKLNWNGLVRSLAFLNALRDNHQLRDMISQQSSFSPEIFADLEQKYQLKKAMGEKAMESPASDIAEEYRPSLVDSLSNGTVLMTSYPWMPDTMLRRDAEPMKILGQALKKASYSKCKLTLSTIEGDDIYGIKARKSSRKDEVLFIDHTMTAVTTRDNACPVCLGDMSLNAISLECCGTQFCRSVCGKLAVTSFHAALCGKQSEFAGINEHEPATKCRTLLLERCLAIIIQEINSQGNTPTHPLHSTSLRRLTAGYHGAAIRWTYDADVVWPTQMMQSMGVDIFADDRYDTWVIQAIQYRLKNNASDKTGEFYLRGVFPIYSMLNHDCSPNMKWSHIDNGSRIIVIAARDIKKGEELFIDYGDVQDKARPERRRILDQWFDCECPKCVVEGSGSDQEITDFYRKQMAGAITEDQKRIKLQKAQALAAREEEKMQAVTEHLKKVDVESQITKVD